MTRHDPRRDRPEPYALGSARERAYHDLPSLTSRAWGRVPEDDDSFGPRDLGGYGDFREPAPTRARPPQRILRPSQRGRGPREQVRADSSIADEVYRRLTDDERIDAREILMAVSAGVVTLTGDVPTRAMKHRAEDVVAAIRGVREVANHITVDDGRASFGPGGRAVRSGRDQLGSGFSSSGRTEDEWREPSIRPGRLGHENLDPEQQAARRKR